MLGDAPRGTKRTRPKGWGMYSICDDCGGLGYFGKLEDETYRTCLSCVGRGGTLLAFHEDEDVVRRWARNRKGEAEVKVREIWEA